MPEISLENLIKAVEVLEKAHRRGRRAGRGGQDKGTSHRKYVQQINRAIRGKSDSKDAYSAKVKKLAEGNKLTAQDIKNTLDLDVWVRQNPQKVQYNGPDAPFWDTKLKRGDYYTQYMSHYDALTKLFGERKADEIMRNLEVASWKLPTRKAQKG